MIKPLGYIFLFLLFVSCVNSQVQKKVEWPSLADSAWPIMWGDAQATGRSEFVGPSTANVVVKTHLPLGILYGPIIGYNNMLYFGTNSVNADTTSSGNYFYSYTPDGNPFWIYNTDFEWPNFKPPIATNDSSIYFNSSDGYLYSMSYFGDVEWRYKVENRGGFHTSVAKNGDIYIITDKLLVLTPEGEKKFEKELEEPVSSAVVFSPSGDTLFFHSGFVYNLDSPNYVIAADLEGNTLWKYKLGDSNFGELVIDNSTNIYVLGSDTTSFFDKYIYSIDRNGKLRWKYPIGIMAEYTSPTINKDGDIIFPSRDNSVKQNTIVCLDYWGNKKWEYYIDPYEGQYADEINHGLVCDDAGNIYFGSTDGVYFYAINKNGEFLWQLPLYGNEFDSYPAISSDGTLYIGTQTTSSDQDQKYTLLGVKDKPTSVKNSVVKKYALSQNYPNPFNPVTTIKFTIPSDMKRKTSDVRLVVYDILGRKIKSILNKEMQPGNYEVKFDGSNLSSGIYFYRLQAGNFVQTLKMMLLK